VDDPRLVLIPFATAEVHAALQSALETLGYCARTLSPAAASDCVRDGQTRAIVFLFGAAVRRELALSALDRVCEVPSLAMFTEAAGPWDRAILERCCDFAHWPCAGEELASRLCRLCGKPEATPDDTLDPTLVETLAALNLVGTSTAFLEAMRRVRRLVRCDAPVLLRGETGTGKELVARAIHYLGPRAGGPFVPINCGALPDHLVENELFGHEKGAFTDAKSTYPGAVGEAAGGTLFLDEVEALSPKAQAALLRFLQDREYRRLGGSQICRSSARVLAASKADLRDLCERREFRSDLFFRLDILSVNLPPLRAREGDAEILASHFVARYARQYGLGRIYLDRRCLPSLREYAWPGNVRELENLVHRQVLMADGPRVLLNPGAAEVAPAEPPADDPLWGGTFAEAKVRAIESFERRYLTRLMDEANGNVSQAARRANKERRALGKLLKKYQLSTHSRG
jgi:DNA-binding NtrC family response regulator